MAKKAVSYLNWVPWAPPNGHPSVACIQRCAWLSSTSCGKPKPVRVSSGYVARWRTYTLGCRGSDGLQPFLPLTLLVLCRITQYIQPPLRSASASSSKAIGIVSSVAVSTAMESQRKGTTPPGIHILGHSFVRQKKTIVFLPSTPGETALGPILPHIGS